MRIQSPPSTMTLGGLLSHLAWVENWWFDEVLDGNDPPEPWASLDFESDNDADWNIADSASGAQLHDLYTRSVERARAQLAGYNLDDLSVRRSHRTDEPYSVRYIVVHMIEEYARHCGHADLLREHIDGVVGV